MLRLKAVLGSLEMMISLPLISAGVIFLIFSYQHSLNGLSSLSGAQALELKQYATSQELITVLKNFNLSRANSVLLAQNYSALYHLNYSIQNLSSLLLFSCIPPQACRIIEVRGDSLLLVIRNASPI
ncbi:MAG: hypothetical protein KGH53_00825 [Candidatus Micrarchaeota archaeon]|nr:hypothetical protein [Candidatus Micrarchaeota archaeon]